MEFSICSPLSIQTMFADRFDDISFRVWDPLRIVCLIIIDQHWRILIYFNVGVTVGRIFDYNSLIIGGHTL